MAETFVTVRTVISVEVKILDSNCPGTIGLIFPAQQMNMPFTITQFGKPFKCSEPGVY